MRLLRKPLLLAAALLSSCTTVEQSAADLAKAHACCSSIADLNFQDIRSNSPTDLAFSERSQTLVFGSIKTFATGVKLPPAVNVTQRLLFEVRLSTQYLPAANAFFPAVVFLDPDKRAITSPQVVPVEAACSFWKSCFFRGLVTVPERSKYAVIVSKRSADYESVDHGFDMQADNRRFYEVKRAETGVVTLQVVTP